MKIFTLISDVKWCFTILIVYGRLDGDSTSDHDFFKAVSFVDVNMVGHLHVFKHVKILCSLHILSGDGSELLVCDFYVDCIVNIRPLRGGSCLLTEFRVSHHEVRSLFEIIKSELFFEGSIAGSLPACTDLLEGFL